MNPCTPSRFPRDAISTQQRLHPLSSQYVAPSSPSSPKAKAAPPSSPTHPNRLTPLARCARNGQAERQAITDNNNSESQKPNDERPSRALSFEQSFHHLRFLEKRHNVVLRLRQDRLDEEERLATHLKDAKALRRIDHAEQVDAFQKDIAARRAVVSEALSRKEQSIQALYFAHPFGDENGALSVRDGPEQIEDAQCSSSIVASQKTVPDVLPLLFRSENDLRVPTVWVTSPLRYCVGDRVMRIPKFTIPTEDERRKLAEEYLVSEKLSKGDAASHPFPISFPPPVGEAGVVLGAGDAENTVMAVFDANATPSSLSPQALSFWRPNTDQLRLGGEGSECESLIDSPTPSTISPFLVNSNGICYELQALDVVLEVTGTAVVVSQVTKWKHSESYLSTLPSQKGPSKPSEHVAAILSAIPGCELISVTADLGTAGVCESFVMSGEDAKRLFTRPQNPNSTVRSIPDVAISTETRQAVLPLGDVIAEETILLKLVYHAASATVKPVGPFQDSNGMDSANEKPPDENHHVHHPYMYEVRFPCNFPPKAFSKTVSFSEMAEATCVLFGVSSWGFIAESYPQLHVKRCHSFQGPRAQFTVCRSDPWSRITFGPTTAKGNCGPIRSIDARTGWENGSDIVFRYCYHMPISHPTHAITMPNQALRDTLHTGFVLTEPYAASSKASSTAVVFIVPSNEPQPEGTLFKRKLHICIDTSCFNMRDGYYSQQEGLTTDVSQSSSVDIFDVNEDVNTTNADSDVAERQTGNVTGDVSLGRSSTMNLIGCDRNALQDKTRKVKSHIESPDQQNGLSMKEQFEMRQQVLFMLHKSLGMLRAGDIVSISCFDAVRGILTCRGDRVPNGDVEIDQSSSFKAPGVWNNENTELPLSTSVSLRSGKLIGEELRQPTATNSTKFLGSHMGVPLHQQLTAFQGAYLVPDFGLGEFAPTGEYSFLLHRWCDAVVADTVALFNDDRADAVVTHNASYDQWYRHAYGLVAEHPSEKSFVTDVVRDILLLGFAEVPPAEQEVIAKFLNSEVMRANGGVGRGIARTHVVYCPTTRSLLSGSSRSFFTALTDKSKGACICLQSNVVAERGYLRGASAVLPYLEPCAMVDVNLQFNGPSRIEGGFTSTVGLSQGVVHFVSLVGDVQGSEGVQMTYRLTRNRKMTKILPSTRTSIPLSFHAAHQLIQTAITSLWWRSYLSSVVVSPSTTAQWLLPVVRRAAAANIPLTVETIIVAWKRHCANASEEGVHQTDGECALNDACISSQVLSSMLLEENPQSASTFLYVATRRRELPITEQVITQGSDVLPISIASNLFATARGVSTDILKCVNGGYSKPLLIKHPSNRDDILKNPNYLLKVIRVPQANQPKQRSHASSISTFEGDRGRRLSSFGGNSSSPSGSFAFLSPSVLLKWIYDTLSTGANLLSKLQYEEISARFLVERVWWECVLECYEVYCRHRSQEQDRALLLLSNLAEVEREYTVAMSGLYDDEEDAWHRLLEDTAPMRMALGRINASYTDGQRGILFSEEDGRAFIEAEQQKIATVAALVVASVGQMCPHGMELRMVYPHIAPNIYHGDGATNVQYFLSAIDVFHTDADVVAFLKTASAVWSARDYVTSKLLGSDGGVEKCKSMLHAFREIEDVVSSILSTIATMSAIRANFSRLSQSGILRDVVVVMRRYPHSRATQLAASKALSGLVPLDPSLLPRCFGGMEALLEGVYRFCNSQSYCLDVLSVFLSVSSATPQSHMLVADEGLSILGSTILARYGKDLDLLRMYLDVMAIVSVTQPLRAVIVANRWAPRIACHVLKGSYSPSMKHKALNALRRLAGNVMERSSIALSSFVCPLLKECATQESDEQLIADMLTLSKRLMLKHDSLSINRDGSHVSVPHKSHTFYARLLPPSLASYLLPIDSIQFLSSDSSEGRLRAPKDLGLRYGVSSPCVFTCPSTGVAMGAEARMFSLKSLEQFSLLTETRGAHFEELLSRLRMACMAMLLADAQHNTVPSLGFMPRCLGIAVGVGGATDAHAEAAIPHDEKVFCAIFQPSTSNSAKNLHKSKILPLKKSVSKMLLSSSQSISSTDGHGIASVNLISFPLNFFTSFAESLFEALVVLSNQRMRHGAIAYRSIGICSDASLDVAGGECAVIRVDFPQLRSDVALIIDPLSCEIRCSADEVVGEVSLRGDIFNSQLNSQLNCDSSDQQKAKPASHVSVYLPTASFITPNLFSELQECLPSLDKQCLIYPTEMAVAKAHCSLLDELRRDGFRAEMVDGLQARAVLLNMLAFGGSVENQITAADVLAYVTVSRRASQQSHQDSLSQVSLEVLRIHWLMQKLPQDLQAILFEPSAKDPGRVDRDLFRHSVSEVWAELVKRNGRKRDKTS